MLKFIINQILFPTLRISNRISLLRVLKPTTVFKEKIKMAGVSSKVKTDSNLEGIPAKKIKLTAELVKTRTVATMCGAWRPEEEDGGMILVFQTRQACVSPDPEKESDFPENIKDFWEATFQGNDDEQVPNWKEQRNTNPKEPPSEEAK